MSKSFWRSAAWKPITRRRGVGCSAMALNWNSGCGGISSPPTNRGVWMRPTLRSKAAGVICIGPSIRRAPRSISCCRPSRCRCSQTAVAQGSELSVDTDVPVRLAVLFIISYATGLIFSTAVVSPFIIFMFGFGYGGFNVLISLTRSRMKLSTQPSSRPSFRRVASAVLGSTLVLQVTRNQAAEPRGILRT